MTATIWTPYIIINEDFEKKILTNLEPGKQKVNSWKTLEDFATQSENNNKALFLLINWQTSNTTDNSSSVIMKASTGTISTLSTIAGGQ